MKSQANKNQENKVYKNIAKEEWLRGVTLNLDGFFPLESCDQDNKWHEKTKSKNVRRGEVWYFLGSDIFETEKQRGWALQAPWDLEPGKKKTWLSPQ